MKTRAEHLAWCKQRALEALNRGDAQEAVTSMISDLGKHDDTSSSVELAGMMGMMELMNPRPDSIRRHIEGLNRVNGITRYALQPRLECVSICLLFN